MRSSIIQLISLTKLNIQFVYYVRQRDSTFVYYVWMRFTFFYSFKKKRQYVVRGGHEVWASERMYSSCLFSESNSNRSITKPEVSVASCKIKNTELIKRAFFQNVFEYEPAINFLFFDKIQNYINFICYIAWPTKAFRIFLKKYLHTFWLNTIAVI